MPDLHAPTAGDRGADLPDWQLERQRGILLAAKEALRSRPYEQVQIRDIASAAGVARATLYRYFPSKELLYLAVILDWVDSLLPSPTGSTAEERIRNLVAKLIDGFEAEPELFRLHSSLHNSTEPTVLAGLQANDDRMHRRLVAELSGLGDDAWDLAIMLGTLVQVRTQLALYRRQDMTDARHISQGFIDLIAERLQAVEPVDRPGNVTSRAD